MMIELKIKRLRANAVTPRRAHEHDAGLDLAPTEFANIEPGRTCKLPTGWAVQIPAGHVGLIVPRSSAKLKGLDAVGVIDSGYVGEVHLAITNISSTWQTIEREAYLCQLLVIPCVTARVVEVDELEPSARGERGFGSSDGER